MPITVGSAEFWRLLHADINAVARDSGGGWFGYEERPTKVERGWAAARGGYWSLGCLDLAHDDTPWEDSLLERPYQWHVPTADTPVDAREWVRQSLAEPWMRRHHAGIDQKGGYLAWCNGLTSWTTRPKSSHPLPYRFAVLANPDNPDQPPPMEWTPEVER